MIMPNFLVIGTAKAGTTSLFSYLKAHPEIFMSSVKEPRFFGFVEKQPNFQGIGDTKVNQALITNIKEYEQLFEKVAHEKAIGEASTWYLYSEEAPFEIKKYIPNAKLIAVLRNPVDRAYSNYLHQRNRSCEEPLDNFLKALQEEEKRIQNNWRPFWHYKNMGFYYIQLSRYFQLFPSKQIRIYLQEDLIQNPINTMQDIFDFLEVDKNFSPNFSRKFNQAYRPKNRVLQNLIMRPNFFKSALKSTMPRPIIQNLGTQIRTFNREINSAPSNNKLPQETRKNLIEEYREDILNLQDLIQRDLSNWLI